MSFHLFNAAYTICWSFFNCGLYSVIPFISSFIHFSMYSFHESLIPFSSTITLLDAPFRQFDPIISFLSFTICFPIRKISFCWLGSFKSLAHSFCFFSFAKEITLFAFCLLFLYSFHASVDFSFVQFPYFFSFHLLLQQLPRSTTMFPYACMGLCQCTRDLCCMMYLS